MRGVVTATGGATFFGRTARLMADAGARSHAEQAVLQIGDFLILLAAALAVVLIVGRVHHDFVARPRRELGGRRAPSPSSCWCCSSPRSRWPCPP